MNIRRFEFTPPRSLLFFCVYVAGCGGPNFFFDKAPAPDWLRQTTSKLSHSRIQMLGTSPTTTQVKNDYNLAVREAKNQIAQLFMSQVVSRSTDWSLSLGREDTEDRQVLQQNIEVRTNVRVDNVKVLHHYRDEETRTQYVLVAVDRRAWATRINLKTETAFTQLSHALETARAALDNKRPLKAYGILLEAFQKGQEIQPDIVVLELLAPRQGAERKLNELHHQLREVSQKLRDRHPVYIQVKAPDTQIARDVRIKLETFFNGYGFSAASSENSIKISVVIDQRFLKKERVAGRKEFVHSAAGSIKVVEPNASEFTSISFHLSPNSYTEQHRDRAQAAENALRLAADAVTSKFRSLFRKEFPQANN